MKWQSFVQSYDFMYFILILISMIKYLHIYIIYIKTLALGYCFFFNRVFFYYTRKEVEKISTEKNDSIVSKEKEKPKLI